MPRGRSDALLRVAALASLAFTGAILVSVASDLDWVRTRAAGGGFETFPVALRVVYAVQAVLVGGVAWFLWRVGGDTPTPQQRTFARVMGLVFVISTGLQLISTSADERWNAIPAGIIAVTFLRLARRDRPA